MACKNISIIITNAVKGFISLNTLQVNEIGIQIVNNSSLVYGNTIQKCHLDGIVIKSTSPMDELKAYPLVISNHIDASSHNGIVCKGMNCKP